DFILTQKRTPATAVIRVTKMSDAQSVPGTTVRAVTTENIELDRAVTDKNGIAVFLRDKIFPEKKPGTHLFIADTANGPAIQFADGSTYSSSGGGGYASPLKPHAEIITDRNLYRPGQAVQMKGIRPNLTVAALTLREHSNLT